MIPKFGQHFPPMVTQFSYDNSIIQTIHTNANITKTKQKQENKTISKREKECKIADIFKGRHVTNNTNNIWQVVETYPIYIITVEFGW